MNRNVESHFALNPTRLDIGRSTFDRSASVKFSANIGSIIPFYVDECLPGDTFKVKTSKVVRLQTMITPMMDNIYFDTYFFFVPNRLVWKHWKQFQGENTESAWLPSTEYEVPQIEAPVGGWNIGTIADYMGIPTGVEGISVNALPFRAYAKICDEWFRDENLSDPLAIADGDATVIGVNTGTFVTDVAKGGLPYTASKYHDYFTSCLPSPQKGPDVTIPVGGTDPIPVVAMQNNIDVSKLPLNNGANIPLRLYQTDTAKKVTSTVYEVAKDSKSLALDTSGTFGNDRFQVPANLYAYTTGSGTPLASINQLRLAFQIQKLYERDARGGSRYVEVLKSHFGVTSPDYRLQRTEYLGGNRIPINVNQIVQQSETTASSALGTPVGLSLTTDSHFDFTKSFTEHGFVIGVCVARYDHTYQQGLERFWSRKNRFDYYMPVFANIGEQAVLNKEIYCDGSSNDNGVFGYQEAWADYRYKNNRVCGEMRSSFAQSLDCWHLADDYNALPSLSDGWIREDKSNVDRVLAVNSSVSNQLFADIYVQNTSTRPMPMYSVPGLIDHH